MDDVLIERLGQAMGIGRWENMASAIITLLDHDRAALGEAASVLMVGGYIQAAQRLVDHGCTPSPTIAASLLPLLSGNPYHVISEQDLPFEHALMRARRATPQRPHPRIKLDVLAHIRTHSDQWPWRPNLVEDNKSTLMWAVELECMNNDSAVSHPHFFPVVSVQEKEQVLHALVEMGEDPNCATMDWTVLMSIGHSFIHCPQVEPGGEAGWKTMNANLLAYHERMIDVMRGLGADLNINSHMGYASALRNCSYWMWGLDKRSNPLPLLYDLYWRKGITLSDAPQCKAVHSVVATALVQGHKRVLKHLLKNNISFTWSDPSTGNTLWHVAADAWNEGNKREVHKALLSLSPDLLKSMANTANHKGWMPMHAAASALALPLMQHIHKAGGDLNGRTKSGQLPLEVIRKHGRKAQLVVDDLFAWVKAQGGQTHAATTKMLSKSLATACNTLAVGMVTDLMEQGAGAHQEHAAKQPAFRCLDAIKTMTSGRRKNYARQLQCLEALHAHGLDVNALDGAGNSLLHCAVERMLPEVVAWLLSQGARTDMVNASGDHAFHCLRQMPGALETDCRKIMQAFIDHQVDTRLLNAGKIKGFAVFSQDPLLVAHEQQFMLRDAVAPYHHPDAKGQRKM